MKTTGATGHFDVAMTINVQNGEIVDVRALSLRHDQEAAAKEIVGEITNPKREEKMRERKICIQDFERTSCDTLLATFTLEFFGLLIPRCGVFYSRRGNIAFQLPYDAGCEIWDEDRALILKKLTEIVDERKTEDPDYFDKADEDIMF